MMVSEGMEVWVSWESERESQFYKYRSFQLVVYKMKSEKERDVLDKCEEAKEGGNRGKDHE